MNKAMIKELSVKLAELEEESSAVLDATDPIELSMFNIRRGWREALGCVLNKFNLYAGYIYILVNPAFPGLVKLGYTDNLSRRLKELNSETSTPYPFHCYASLMVEERLGDLHLHKLIDTINPELRASKNREFYAMSPETAFTILETISVLSGTENALQKNPLNDVYFW